jgi:DNA-binding MarR family transcriptional regulator
MPRTSKTLHDRLSDTGRTTRRVRIPVDALALLAGEPNVQITFSDLAAVLGMGLQDADKAVRVLRHAGLIERTVVTGSFNRSKYELTGLGERLLARRPVDAPGPRPDDLFDQSLATAADHNSAARLSRVTALNLAADLGSSRRAAEAGRPAFRLVITISVLPVPALTEEISGMLHEMWKRMADQAGLSLVLETV